MTLSSDERQLLELFAAQSAPVDAFTLYRTMNPPGPGLEDDEERHQAWMERQMELTDVALALWRRELVRVAVSADGENADQMEITTHGHEALAQVASADR